METWRTLTMFSEATKLSVWLMISKLVCRVWVGDNGRGSYIGCQRWVADQQELGKWEERCMEKGKDGWKRQREVPFWSPFGARGVGSAGLVSIKLTVNCLWSWDLGSFPGHRVSRGEGVDHCWCQEQSSLLSNPKESGIDLAGRSLTS